MSVQDIANSQGLGNSLGGSDPLSIMSNGQATPSEIAALYQDSQQQQDVQGLGVSVVNPDTLNTGADIAKARAEFQRNGLPEGIEKPSAWGKLEDMLGSLLVGVALSALLGMDGKGAIGLGLMASGSALDLDNAKAQRYDAIMEMDKTGINPAALVDYYNTGNMKSLQHYEDERNKREDALTGENWKREDAATAEDWKRTDATTQYGRDMAKEQYIQGQENARNRMNQDREDARASLKAGGGSGVAGATPYGYMTDTNGDGAPDTWIETSKNGTVSKDSSNNIHQFKATPNGWVDEGYIPETGAGGNTKSDTANQTAGDVIDKASLLAKQNYTTHSSSLGRAWNSMGNAFTGNKSDFNRRADVFNNTMAALYADRAVNSTGGKSVLKEDMKKQVESGGKISASNSPEVNQEILDNNINLAAGVQYINEYQNNNHGAMPSISEYKQGRNKKRAEIYKEHPELLNAFGETNDLPGQSGNINSPVGQNANNDYSHLWK